jgi:hypothetical protein
VKPLILALILSNVYTARRLFRRDAGRLDRRLAELRDGRG